MKRVFTLAALLAAACGGTGAANTETNASNSSTLTSGAIHGKAFAPVEAAAGAFDTLSLTIALSDTANFGSTVQQGHWPRGWSGLKLNLYSVDARGQILTPTAGTYAIGGATKSATARYSLEDDVCAEKLAKKATGVSGSVVLTGGSNGAWSGTYDVVFDNGDHVTGPFSAAYCPALGNFQFACDPIATPAVAGTVSGASGSIHGTAFAPMDAMVNIRTFAPGGSLAQINLFDQPAVCAAIQSSRYPSGLGNLILDVYESATDDPSGAAPPTHLGTFPVRSTATAGRGSGGAYYKADSSYNTIGADSAQVRDGSVTLTSISDGTYAGSYDLIMDTGDHLTGSFSAPYCPNL